MKDKTIRIVSRYSPCVGTWYVIQKRILWWWFDLPYSFHDFHMAKQMVNYNLYNDGYIQQVKVDWNNHLNPKYNKPPWETYWEPSVLFRIIMSLKTN